MSANFVPLISNVRDQRWRRTLCSSRPGSQPLSVPEVVVLPETSSRDTTIFRYENRWIRRITVITRVQERGGLVLLSRFHSLKEKRKKNSSRPIRLTCVQLIKFVASKYAPTVSKVGTISRMRLIPALRARLQLLRSRITSFLRRPDTYITAAKLPSRSKSKGFWEIRHASLEPCARRLSRCVNDNIL